MNAPLLPFDKVEPAPEELRHKIEAAVEHLLALLDALDGAGVVEDLEEGGDKEPTAGNGQLHDEREPEEDAEPSLGWAVTGQLGGVDDSEQDEGDLEPWLGWTVSLNQAGRNWSGEPPLSGRLSSSVPDGEQGDDTGIADRAGLRFDDEPGDNEDGGAEDIAVDGEDHD